MFVQLATALCPHTFVPWRRRMEHTIDAYVWQKAARGLGDVLSVADVELIESSNELKFAVTKETVLVVECPFDGSWGLNASFMPGCEKCRVQHSWDRVTAADIHFRFGYAQCAGSQWPNKSSPSQLYASTTGEARHGTGRWYHDSRARMDEDVTVGFEEHNDIAYSFSEFGSLIRTSVRPHVSDIAAQWFQPISIAAKLDTALALAVHSNCNPVTPRNRIVAELRKFGVAVDAAGACETGHQARIEILPQDKSRYQAKIRTASRYRFLFALENTIEKHYVTEKLHHAYLSGSVPIVWQRDICGDICPHQSFIAVDDFASVENLAEWLKYLARNDTAYLQYFRWKQFGVTASVVKMLFRSIDLVGCQLCEMHSQNFSSKHCGGANNVRLAIDKNKEQNMRSFL